jgi:hypothetical protein
MTGAAARRVLVLCHAFPPANHVSSMRPVRIGNAFRKRGWDVHVLKSGFGHSPRTLSVDTSAFRITSYDPHAISRIITEAPVNRSARSLLLSFARRLVPPDHSWLMWKPIMKAIDELGGLGQFDCVVSTAFPFVLHDICRARKARGERFAWVADSRDMWAGSPYRRPQVIPTSYLRRVEARVFAACDLATFASETTARIYASRHRMEAMVVLNGVESPPPSATAQTPGGLLKRFVHTGGLYGGQRDLRPLLDALGQVAAQDERECELVLAGQDSRAVAGTWPETPGVQVEALGLVSREAAARLQSEADALVLAMADTDFDATYTPAKLFEYAFADKPIVALAREESDVGRLVERHRLGVASFDPGKIVRFIAAAEKGEWTGAHNVHELTADAQFGTLVDAVERCMERR